MQLLWLLRILLVWRCYRLNDAMGLRCSLRLLWLQCSCSCSRCAIHGVIHISSKATQLKEGTAVLLLLVFG
jgi:hypothetical protein